MHQQWNPVCLLCTLPYAHILDNLMKLRRNTNNNSAVGRSVHNFKSSNAHKRITRDTQVQETLEILKGISKRGLSKKALRFSALCILSTILRYLT